VVASYPEKRIFVGNLIKIDNNNNTIIPENLQTKITNLESERKTIVAVFIEYKLACHDSCVFFVYYYIPSTNNHFILLSSPIICIIRKGNETISLP